MKKDDGKIAKLLSIVDLTDLEPARRVSLIGHDNFMERRKFLKSLLGAGIVIGLPFLTSCNKSNPVSEENKDFPLIIRTTPSQNSTVLLDDDQNVEVKIVFDHEMDETSMLSSVVITPQPVDTVHVTTVNDPTNTAEPCTITIYTQNNKCKLLYSQNYSITVKGTAKDKKGAFLDGNKDGQGGDDFVLTFTTDVKPVWPKVLNTVPAAGAMVAVATNEMNGVEIFYNKEMEPNSVAAAISISPEPTGGHVIVSGKTNDTKGAYKSYIFSPNSNTLLITPGTQYSVTVKGSAKDTEGYSLDGNGDGVNKDDFTFGFSTKYLPPAIKATIPTEGQTVELSAYCYPIHIDFDREMDLDSINSALTISPPNTSILGLKTRMVQKSNVYELQLYNEEIMSQDHVCILTTGAKYTVTIKGTAKDKHGNFLDGNNDGTGGDDFVLHFSTVAPSSCSCVGNVCSCVGNVCSCVGNSCSSDIGLGCPLNGCSGYWCDCQSAGCPTYRI
ncbi:MAG: Ig-like domain-containing protein [Bacteroidota bacterium]